MIYFFIQTIAMREGGERLIYVITPFLIVASGYDILKGRIPNQLVFGLYAVGMAYTCWTKGVQAIPEMLAGIIIPICVLFVVFMFRGIGAGDIKLFSALGSIFCLQIFEVMLYAFIFGAMQAIGRIILNVVRKENCNKIPFALSICVSALYVGWIN